MITLMVTKCFQKANLNAINDNNKQMITLTENWQKVSKTKSDEFYKQMIALTELTLTLFSKS
jgi:hypothetical protein